MERHFNRNRCQEPVTYLEFLMHCKLQRERGFGRGYDQIEPFKYVRYSLQIRRNNRSGPGKRFNTTIGFSQEKQNTPR